MRYGALIMADDPINGNALDATKEPPIPYSLKSL